jgi:Peptide N-acetyl-beta-D-glucosaminyl asparaginase amidase A
MCKFRNIYFSMPLLALLATLLLISSTSAAQQVGSPDTVTADPSVPHPHTTPCVVKLFQNDKFENFNVQSFPFTPPAACPGPWGKVILQGHFLVTAGVQFDRTANIWIGGTNIYFGTTPEPRSNVSPHWHFERDLTDYSALFTTAGTGTVILGNLVNSTFTGIIHGGVDLEFYPVEASQTAPVTADMILPLSAGPTGGTATLTSTSTLLAQSFTMPANVERAFLDVFAQSQNADEFWYTCVPNDATSALESCGGTAFREAEITIDGTPAGVAPVYPWIFTGGIDPFLWAPIPGVQTLEFVPYRVNLTPFAGLLSNGTAHTVAVSVFNADNFFSATASLLLYLDHGSAQVTGAILRNSLTAAPNPRIIERLNNKGGGSVNGGTTTGTVNTTAPRQVAIAGFVDTSHGRVTTEVHQSIHFSNLQKFDIVGLLGVNPGAQELQDISQNTTISSMTTVKSGGNTFVNSNQLEWPLTVDISFVNNADGSFTQVTSIQQAYNRSVARTLNGIATFSSTLANSVTTADTLFINSSFQITGNQGQASSQNYSYSDTTGLCYRKALAAANSLLTSVTTGHKCGQ